MSSVRNVRPFETSIRTKRLPETKYVRTKCLRAKRLRTKRLPYETSIRTKRLLAAMKTCGASPVHHMRCITLIPTLTLLDQLVQQVVLPFVECEKISERLCMVVPIARKGLNYQINK